jgi:alpha-ketoglutarate-dependent taurine dioxygenase
MTDDRASKRERAAPDFGRRAAAISQQDLVTTSLLDPERRLPLVIEPRLREVSLAGWLAARREWLAERLRVHGAVLFRNFGIDTMAQFEESARAFSPELLDYQERAAPRTEMGKNIYTSTEFPADQAIHLHHEMSYSNRWPRKLWFFCLQPAAAGGRTPIADDRLVIGRIDAGIKDEFLRKKVMYVRNYGEGIDLSWQEAFQTRDRGQVEAYCKQAGMSVEWKAGDRLRTRAVRAAVAVHPQTGDTVWFNHAHMFHVSSLQPATREALLAQFGEDELPRNALYGDGSPIEDQVLDEIRQVYEETAIRFDWQQGDVLVVDNILASHGREPFSGPRQILVAMADLYSPGA